MNLNRRTALQVGGISALGLTHAGLLEAGVNENDEKALIWIYLDGGASFVELWNPLENSTFQEYRSVTGFIDTAISGVKFAGGMEGMAALAKDITVVRGYQGSSPDHSFGKHFANTGYESRSNNQTHPSFGSMISKINGGVTKDGIPIFNKTANLEHDSAAWLGPAYDPFDVNSDAKKNFLPQVEHQRLQERAAVLAAMDKFQKDNPKIKDLNRLKNQAYNIIFGKAREAFEIEKEPQSIKDLYGNGLGKQLLQARRLIQYGSKCVQCVIGGWDLHQNIKDGSDRLVPQLDKAVSALLTDLKNQGMLNNVMVVITSEFSRTKYNSTMGRDHNSRSCPLAIMGGSFNHGQIIGSTDSTGLVADNNVCHANDLAATIFKHFGIGTNTQGTNHEGRPIYFVNKGKSIL